VRGRPPSSAVRGNHWELQSRARCRRAAELFDLSRGTRRRRYDLRVVRASGSRGATFLPNSADTSSSLGARVRRRSRAQSKSSSDCAKEAQGVFDKHVRPLVQVCGVGGKRQRRRAHWRQLDCCGPERNRFGVRTRARSDALRGAALPSSCGHDLYLERLSRILSVFRDGRAFSSRERGVDGVWSAARLARIQGSMGGECRAGSSRCREDGGAPLATRRSVSA
jgi:hypothetical protein